MTPRTLVLAFCFDDWTGIYYILKWALFLPSAFQKQLEKNLYRELQKNISLDFIFLETKHWFCDFPVLIPPQQSKHFYQHKQEQNKQQKCM